MTAHPVTVHPVTVHRTTGKVLSKKETSTKDMIGGILVPGFSEFYKKESRPSYRKMCILVLLRQKLFELAEIDRAIDQCRREIDLIHENADWKVEDDFRQSAISRKGQ